MLVHGIYAILVTPFNEQDQVDEQDLRNQVRFCAEAGGHGVVGPAVFAEFHTLSDNERRRFIEVAAEAAKEEGIPFIACCSGASAAHAVEFARHAERVGADAIMAMPPYVEKVPSQAAADYFRRVAASTSLPVVLQNPPALLGWSVDIPTMAQLVRELPNARYVKEETVPEHHHISALIQQAGDALQGVFGGLGGIYMMAELRRGAVGNMPAPEFLDVHVAIYNAFKEGDEARAEELYRRLLPAIVFEGLIGPQYSKEVLRRRGVIKSTGMRTPRSPMDRHDHRELDRMWPELESLFTWKGWKTR